jgi:EVE domain
MNTWIFQANPLFYDIDAALASLPEISWLVKAHRDKINPGDEVFLWKSGTEGGILGKATVLTTPGLMEQEGLQFAVQPDKFNTPQMRVRLRIDEVYAPPLSRDVLKADVRLAELSILKFSQGTNFAVTPEEAAVIHALRETHQSCEDEIPGGAGAVEPRRGSRVWAYAPGPRAQFWEEFYREGIMAIGWDDLGELRQYADHDAVAKQLIEAYHLKGYPINDSRACYDFLHSMSAGDRS